MNLSIGGADEAIAELEALQYVFTPAQCRRIYELYMRVKMQVGDMHGVSDVANDIRVHDAEFAQRLTDSPLIVPATSEIVPATNADKVRT